MPILNNLPQPLVGRSIVCCGQLWRGLRALNGVSSCWQPLKAEPQWRALLANVHPVEAVLNRTVVIHPDRGRERKPLAQLGRVEGAGKGVMPLAPLVKRERIPPPAGRRVALGQQVLDEGFSLPL